MAAHIVVILGKKLVSMDQLVKGKTLIKSSSKLYG